MFGGQYYTAAIGNLTALTLASIVLGLGAGNFERGHAVMVSQSVIYDFYVAMLRCYDAVMMSNAVVDIAGASYMGHKYDCPPSPRPNRCAWQDCPLRHRVRCCHEQELGATPIFHGFTVSLCLFVEIDLCLTVSVEINLCLTVSVVNLKRYAGLAGHFDHRRIPEPRQRKARGRPLWLREAGRDRKHASGRRLRQRLRRHWGRNPGGIRRVDPDRLRPSAPPAPPVHRQRPLEPRPRPRLLETRRRTVVETTTTTSDSRVNPE